MRPSPLAVRPPADATGTPPRGAVPVPPGHHPDGTVSLYSTHKE